MGIAIINLASLDGNNGFRIQGMHEYGGATVSNAGDLNGDGFDDVVVGAPGGDLYSSGSSYVVFGKAAGFDATFEATTLDGSNGFHLQGNTSGLVGSSVSGGGDINGDGFDDLLVGAPFDGSNYFSPAGAIYVVFGKASGFSATMGREQLDGSDGFVLNGVTDGDLTGEVSNAGDVNGDGFDDVIVGAGRADLNGERSGAGYVVFGKASGFDASFNLSSLNGNNGFRMDGGAAGDSLGADVSTAGDVNDDGFADLLISAPGADTNGNNSSSSYVVFGKATGFNATLDLSGLDGSNGFRLDGAMEGGQSSFAIESVNGAGDVNGDGFDDVIIGTSRVDSNGNGSAASYVIFGKTSGFDATLDLSSLDGTNGFRLDGAGNVVGSAGDVNGDGVDDLIVGAPFVSPTGLSAGSTSLIYGKNSGFDAVVNVLDFDAADGVRLDGAGAHDRSGSSVSGAGDVNGDGFDDLMISTYLYSFGGGYSGAAYVIFGSNQLTGMTVISGTGGDDVLTGTVADDRFEAGDGNDVLIGGGGRDIFQAGAGNDIIQVPDVNFHFADGGPGDNALELTGSRATLSLSDFDSKTDNIETIDLTGDGNNLFNINFNVRDMTRTLTILGDAGDRIAGITSEWTDEGVQDDFHIYTFSDTDTSFTLRVALDITRVRPFDLSDLNGTNGFRLDGDESVDLFNSSVSNAGDVNGDGFDDVIVGVPWAGPKDSGGDSLRYGSSYVVLGKASGFGVSLDLSSLNGSNGFRLEGKSKYDYSGQSVSSAGDVNGDGFDDVIVGAVGAGPRNPDGDSLRYGASYVVFGKASGFDASFNLGNLDGSNGFRLNGENEYDVLGASVSSAGDVNGDGFDDVIVGAYRADVNGYNSGASYVVFGKASGFAAAMDLSSLDGNNGFRLNGENENNRLGTSVSSAGDVNGDGFGDLIVGASSSYAAGYVVFGKASGFTATMDLSSLDGSNGFRLDDLANQNGFGRSVSNAGDVNGDGFDDVIVKQSFFKSYGNSPESMCVVFGKASGFDATVDLSSLDGNNGFRIDDFASSVSNAGDVNGDGFDDVIIGASNSGLGGNRTGGSYVMFGKASGFDAVTNLAYLDDGVAGFSITEEGSFNHLGNSVSGAGDVNGDGFDDLMVGASFGVAPAYIIFGSSDIGKGDSSGQLPEIVGTPGDDVLRGTSAAERFEAGAGNDRMIGRGGADVFEGEAGHDYIRVSDLGFESADGGTGNDILGLGGSGLNLDLASMGGKIKGIETIYLLGTGDNTLTLTAADVLNLSDTSDTLKVNGNAGDHITVLDDGWVDGGSCGYGHYHVYTNDEAVLLVGVNVTVDFA